MNILISIPMWVAAGWLLLIGFVGVFDPKVRGPEARFALACLPAGSVTLLAASWMCGLV